MAEPQITPAEQPHPKEPLLAESRRFAILELLRVNGAVSVTEVQNRLGVSSMTARRDLAELANRGLAQRTHGGAVLPALSSHEDSFALRLEADTSAKLALAREGALCVQPRDTIFIDSSTTSYFVVRQLLEIGIEFTLLTNSLPVMHLVANQGSANVNLIAVGGTLRRLTQSFVGPYAVSTVAAHYADHTFMSVKAITAAGVMLDADALEAEVKRAMVKQANHPVLLIDHSKLSARGLNAILPVSDMSLVVAYGLTADELRVVRKNGTKVTTVT